MTTPKFNSPALTASFEANRRYIEKHRLHLDQMSGDIKVLEKYLDEQGVRVEYKYGAIELEPCITAYLSWAQEEKSQRWRIMCAVNVEVSDHSSWDVRPLIEMKADIRVAVYDYLPDFFEKVSAKMRVSALENRANVDPTDGQEWEVDDSSGDDPKKS